MCGICGKLNLNGLPDSSHRDVLGRMMQAMRHRGPDDDGLYISGPVGLGHRRLSIIDLSTGKQPIGNEDGTVWIVFNGEIYNYKELRASLLQRGHQFHTASDTEVIVHLYEEYGAECASRLRGMFAFAIWDERTKTLLLARDRVGIKPLYYHLSNEALIFASEVKALLEDPSVTRTADPSALATFLTYKYPPGEKTLFKNILKLSPGHYLIAKDGKLSIKQYWDLQFNKFKPGKSLDDCTGQLTELLRETVRDHMISDVPVGVLLSGGVDSTAMLSFAVEETNKQISTFTIGFEGTLCTDERPFASLAARKYGTKHYEMTITARDFLDFLPKYVWYMEEPVCEPPAIALYYVSKLARQHVTVLISGEGGDEAFAGYQTYRNLVWLEKFKRALGPLARPAAVVAAGLGKLAGLRSFGRYVPLMNLPLSKYYYSRTSNPFSFFNRNQSELYAPEFLASVNGNGPARVASNCFAAVEGLEDLDQMLYVDTKTWLPDDLLIKADKMTMANSLELRVPLLDHQVLEFAASLPPSFKLHGFKTKYILKRALTKRIPPEIRDRKKTGFPVPYHSWIRNDFKDIIWAVLTDRKTIQRGYFKPEAVTRLLKANAGGADYSPEVFSLLTLELWHRTFLDREQVALH